MITVLGSVNLDLVATADRLPVLGETVTGSSFLTAPGGKGANQALAARRAGASVRMAAAVGRDDFAASATALLREAGVDMSAVRSVPAPTGTALILVDAKGENMITVIPGANAKLSPADAERTVAAMAPGDLLMLQLETPLPTVEAALAAARRKGVTSILNVAPYVADAAALARQADIVIANRLECCGLLGREDDEAFALEEALLALHGEVGVSIIATLGADGALAINEQEAIRAASLAVSPLDTVGAGDTFCGYFAAGIDRGQSFSEALSRAAFAGALACLKPGAQTAIPTAEEVESHATQAAHSF
ncbi:ribokinase [Methyloligella sp. 2.7D]|uniref:ribokinase n=1 Tax=unclassified Methyloligella TaxID=2625955 RepID=UPI00157DEA95|nr:ribokinase [Methyloligella sp. GL2]QKP76947.1 ribokinase [Methyloligella sp. GL2]